MKQFLANCSLSFMLLITSNSFAQDAKQLKTLNDYKNCLLKADKNLISQFISNDFRAGVYQYPMTSNLFVSFLETVQKPDSIYWEKIKKTDAKNVCKVHYITNKKEEISNVVFSNDGKLLYSDWIDQKGMNFNRYGESKKIATFPFVYENGSIIIKAQLNSSDKVLNMIFDTGADGLALRADLQTEMNVKTSESRTVNVPGGQVQVNYSAGNTLKIGDFVLQNQSMVMFPKIKTGIDGLIGGAVLFRQYRTEIDFENNQIVLYSFGKSPSLKEYTATPLNYKDGVPSIPIQIISKGNSFNSEFIIDAGAAFQAIMFGSGTKQQNEALLNQSLIPLYQTYNYSMANKSPIKIAMANEIRFAGLQFTDACLAVESYDTTKHQAHTINGSIGVEFLRRCNWMIDLESYTFYSKKNRYTDLPLDFIIADYLIAYNNNTLMVKRYLKSEDGRNPNPEAPLYPGDVIDDIQGVTAKDLKKSNIQQFQKEKNIKFNIRRKGASMSVIL